MKPKLTSVIQYQEFKTLYDSNAVSIFDLRSGPTAHDQYLESHLDKAVYVSLDSDLATIDDFSKGGRHPLPTPARFAKILGKLGIDKNTHVVIYDDKNGANAAARFWWMLRSFGHEKVQVLDGGLQEALRQHFPTNSGEESIVETQYPLQSWQWPTVDMSQVEEATNKEDFEIIDVREAARYNGITEPIDLVAGHIPSAVNIPFNDNLDDKGFFLSQDLLQDKYQSLFEDYKPDNIIVHCGSGVTACHTILAMDYAGYDVPNLYVGSWGEWSRNKH